MLQIAIWKQLTILAVCAAGLLAALPNAFYSRVEGHNDAVAASDAGSQLDEAMQEALAGWPSWLPAGLVNLGLDLRGGAHLLAEVNLADVHAERLDALWPEIRDALREKRSAVGTVRRQPSDPGQLRVRVSQRSGIESGKQAVEQLARPIVSLTAVGASDIKVSTQGDELIVELTEDELAATDERTMRQSLEIIRRRVDEVGTREPSIVRQGSDRIVIQVPGIGSAEELKDLIGATAKLTFHPVVRTTSDKGASPGAGNVVFPSIDEPNRRYILEKSPVVSGEELTDAQPDFDQNGRPAVSFRFNPSGARKFGDYTAANIGSPFAIVLDGEVISAPVIQDHIAGGSGIITGIFSVEETNRLAILLRAGALPAGMTFLEERTVGPGTRPRFD